MNPVQRHAKAIHSFREFLKIPSISSQGVQSGAYSLCADYLARQLRNIGPEIVVRLWYPSKPTGSATPPQTSLRGAPIQCAAGHNPDTLDLEPLHEKPVVIATWKGSEPSLPAILLTGHYDVVPVEEEKWTRAPFGGDQDELTGRIYGRGAQDMKCNLIQYVEAIRVLYQAREGRPLRRTIHMTAVPDEEIGGAVMRAFVADPKGLATLGVGVALDEGLANPTDAFTLFYGERALWWVRIVAEGPVGHGSRFIPGTATQKLVTCVNRLLNFRAEQEALLHDSKHCHKKLGDVTTINLTALEAGDFAALNVIPSVASAGFDVRLPPSVDLAVFEDKLREWTRDPGLSYVFHQYAPTNPATDAKASTNAFFAAFASTFETNGWTFEKEIFPAATDGRFLRGAGLPVLGFSPMNQTTVLMHDHDEYVAQDVFARGIDMYVKIVEALASVDAAAEAACAKRKKRGASVKATAANGQTKRSRVV